MDTIKDGVRACSFPYLFNEKGKKLYPKAGEKRIHFFVRNCDNLLLTNITPQLKSTNYTSLCYEILTKNGKERRNLC